ncbi:conserved hypothetical protein [Tenacibaculum maritimum]|uniref:hypothetical protein n=1 Tax=Tenacibaculum maritimum TaxID=107401 RepID=UPI0012E5D0F5|nr:hypothetical protein [Tenacibaculum maritimum]CAA0170767.1 conserved hypothetical protein [Tenacibaculum maritimum]
MDETIPIQKEAALKAYKNANSKGKTLLENLLGKKLFLKEVTDRIKTVADVLEDNNITQEKIEKMFAHTPERFKYQFIAELLCKSLNEGWCPKRDNSNEYKYYPLFKMDSSGFRFGGYAYWRTVGSRLSFKSQKLAEYAGKQFEDLYKKIMINQ